MSRCMNLGNCSNVVREPVVEQNKPPGRAPIFIHGNHCEERSHANHVFGIEGVARFKSAVVIMLQESQNRSWLGGWAVGLAWQRASKTIRKQTQFGKHPQTKEAFLMRTMCVKRLLVGEAQTTL